MTDSPARIWPAVLISLLAGLVLSLLPLPALLQPWRPSWIALIVVYWLLYEPRRVGLLLAWVTGLLLDTLRGALLGQHALALVIMGFIALQFHLRVRVFPIGQQTATVFMLIAVYEFFLYWVDGLSGEPGGDWRRWLSVMSSALVWPVVALLIGSLRRMNKSVRSVH